MSTQDWTSWMERLASAQQDVRESSPVDAERQADQCLLRAQDATRRSAEAIGTHCSQAPDTGERRNIRNALLKRINEVPERDRSMRHRQYVRGWQQHLDSINDKESSLADAVQKLKEIREVRQEAETHLAEVKAQQPEASHAALKAVADAIEEAEGEKLRIENALAAMDDDDSAASLAEREAEEARSTLDDLEAAAALGKHDEERQKAAITALAKARKKAEQARQDAQRQASARRGLERKLSDSHERLEELHKVHRVVASRVYMADMEKAERRLVDLIESPEIKNTLATINDIRERLESVEPESGYRRAYLEVRLPGFYAHPDRERLDCTEVEL